MTDKKETGTGVDRRGLLRFLGSGAAGTAAVAAGAVTTPTPVDAAESAKDRTKKRYRETDHVKAYYRTNRY